MVSQDLANWLDWLQDQITTAIVDYFSSVGYTYKEMSQNGFLPSMEIESDRDEEYTDVYIYSEISINEFESMHESWDCIAKIVDPSAYFEAVKQGVYVTRIYWAFLEDADEIGEAY